MMCRTFCTIAGLALVLIAGCSGVSLLFPDIEPPEMSQGLKSIYDHPEDFVATPVVEHQGSLETLEDCWGSMEVDVEGFNVLFFQLENDAVTWEMYQHTDMGIWGYSIYVREEGTAFIQDDLLVVSIVSDYVDGLGNQTTEEFDPPWERTYQVRLDGDTMEYSMIESYGHPLGDEVPQYEGVFHRMSCP